MGMNLSQRISHCLEVHFILYFPKDEPFWMRPTTVVRLGKNAKVNSKFLCF